MDGSLTEIRGRSRPHIYHPTVETGPGVDEIPSTRSALETPRPSPVVASRPLRWLSVARRSATPPPRRGGFSLSLVGCCPRAPRRTSPSPAGEVSSHPPSVRRGSAALLLRAVRGSPERRSRKLQPRDARQGRHLGPHALLHWRQRSSARARKRRPWPCTRHELRSPGSRGLVGSWLLQLASIRRGGSLARQQIGGGTIAELRRSPPSPPAAARVALCSRAPRGPAVRALRQQTIWPAHLPSDG